MEDFEKKIIDRIVGLSGKYSPYNIFSDWVECCALAICNCCHLIHDNVWKDREKLYMDISGRYEPKEQEAFVEMFVWLAYALEQNMSDVLGSIYMKAGLGSKYTGQFFTPFHLSELCARLNLENLEPDHDGVYRLNEPSCGGGGMIIAACKVLKDKGINYQRKVDVVAQDLDWKGVYMTYLQLSLVGVKALVVQGDTLAEPYMPGKTPKDRIMATPMKMGCLI